MTLAYGCAKGSLLTAAAHRVRALYLTMGGCDYLSASLAAMTTVSFCHTPGAVIALLTLKFGLTAENTAPCTTYSMFCLNGTLYTLQQGIRQASKV